MHRHPRQEYGTKGAAEAVLHPHRGPARRRCQLSCPIVRWENQRQERLAALTTVATVAMITGRPDFKMQGTSREINDYDDREPI